MKLRFLGLDVYRNLDAGTGAAAQTATTGDAAQQTAAQTGDAAKPTGLLASAQPGDANAQQQDVAATAAYWPEGLPEHLAPHKGATDRETIDRLAAIAKAAPVVPAKPEEYVLTLEKSFAEKFGLDADPVMKVWRNVAHQNGMSNEQFNKIVPALYGELEKQGFLLPALDIEAERLKLGGDQGTQDERVRRANVRIMAVNLWRQGLQGSGALTAKQSEMLETLGATAEGVEALEAIMKLVKSTGLNTAGGGVGGQPATDPDAMARKMFPSMPK